jgi:trk system potassium uptake protein TrkH
LHFIDALFTSTSAVCVTGLASVDTSLYSSFGLTTIMLLIQFGGLGLITFTTVYIMLPRKRISLVNRGIVKDFSIDEIDSDPKRIIRNIVLVTFGAEAIGSLSLWMAFRAQGVPNALFVAVFHAVSAFCNAGFSPFRDNLESYAENAQVVLTVCALIVTGGLGFIVCEDVVKRVLGRKRMLSAYSVTVLKTTAFLLALGFVFFLAMEWRGAYGALNPIGKALAALFQSVTPRTAGFDTIPQTSLTGFSVLGTIMLMFIGGSSGSTAGGIKTSTAYILFMLGWKGTDSTNGSLVVRKRAIPNATIVKAVQVFFKAIAFVSLSVSLVCLSENARIAAGEIKLTQVIFECVSAFGTVGLSLGLTMNLSVWSKIIIILTMFVGRVGLVTMAVPAPGKRIEQLVDFATADHIVG